MLSPIEKLVLHRLAWGDSKEEILKKMNLERKHLYPKKFVYTNDFYRKEHFYTVCHSIRRKTGIQDTSNAQECRTWERDHRYSPVQEEKGPTPQQLRVLYMLAIGADYPAIQQSMKLKHQSVVNLASEGRLRAGITDTLPSSAMAYFMKLEHEQALRERKREQMEKHLGLAKEIPDLLKPEGHLNGDPSL